MNEYYFNEADNYVSYMKILDTFPSTNLRIFDISINKDLELPNNFDIQIYNIPVSIFFKQGYKEIERDEFVNILHRCNII